MSRSRASRILVNAARTATLHHCVRLEIRGHGAKRGDPSRVSVLCHSRTERDFGYLSWRTKLDELRYQYPGAELIDTTRHSEAA